MCCSIRGAVFFLASIHLFFAVAQFLYILPVVVANVGETFESTLAFIFCTLFFATGFMTFRGADECSSTLIRLGGFCLIATITFRFLLIAASIKLVARIPEASFLYIYEIPMLPVAFTISWYLMYLVVLFFYYKELKHSV